MRSVAGHGAFAGRLPLIDVDFPLLNAETESFISAISFRDRVRSHSQVTFDELDTSPKHTSDSFEDSLDLMLTNGWNRHGQRLESLTPPLPWKEFDGSFSFSLHAWEPVSFLLKGSCVAKTLEKREKYFQASRAFALDWIENFQVPAFEVGPETAISQDYSKIAGYAWYDMAVGQRIYRLAFVLEQECRDENADITVIELLIRSLKFHNDALAIDGFFRAHSNHGIYQALGQLAACNRFVEVDAQFALPLALAKERLAQILDAHFTDDNIHKEHSPGYHWMVLGSLIGAQQTKLVTDPKILSRFAGMEIGLADMILPNFQMCTFGDSDPRNMARVPVFPVDGEPTSFGNARRFLTENMKFIVTSGHLGQYPVPCVREYKSAGYAFARIHAPGIEPHIRKLFLSRADGGVSFAHAQTCRSSRLHLARPEAGHFD